VPFVGGAEPFKIVSADFDGDGLTDVATANPDGSVGGPALGTVSVFLADGAGGFRAAVQYPESPFPVGITAADFDG